MDEKIEKILQELYYEDLIFKKNELYKRAKSIDNRITLKIVDSFLKSQGSYEKQANYVVKRNMYNTIVAKYPSQNIQIDILVNEQFKQNKNVRYILLSIDVYSRKAFYYFLKNRTGEELLRGILYIFYDMDMVPNSINADNEFGTNAIIKFCEDHDIELYLSDPKETNKQAIVERFNRTVREWIREYQNVKKTKNFINAFPTFIKNYNNTVHGTTKNTPNDIWDGKEQNEQEINRVEYPFKIGDRVRYAIKKMYLQKSLRVITGVIYMK